MFCLHSILSIDVATYLFIDLFIICNLDLISYSLGEI